MFADLLQSDSADGRQKQWDLSGTLLAFDRGETQLLLSFTLNGCFIYCSRAKLCWAMTRMILHYSSVTSLALCASLVMGQVPLLQPQNTTFNSSFTLSDEQIAFANLPETVANNVNVALRFEQSNWATGSVLSDPFYTDLPANATDAPAGSLLKVEPFTDTSTYTIAPTLALSRIIYQSKTLNGTTVPVSAYILWPLYPRGGARRAPLVSWGHGTSGVFAECAPSHVRNLWYQFSGPYALALAGYAVVATDYAGLGVSAYANGEPIVHQYVANPAAGYDLLYAAQAAREAFPDQLSEKFVVMGHSQGGGGAWAAAQLQLEIEIPGYLGSIAAAPVTDAIEMSRLSGTSLGLMQAAKAFQSVFPDLTLSKMLTPRGITIADLAEEISTCNSALITMANGVLIEDPSTVLTRDDFVESYYAASWSNMTVAGGKDFKGPLLVIQGTDDAAIPENLTATFVDKTCEHFANRGLHYLTAEGIGHVPIMYATQQLWLDWLDERFKGSLHSSDEPGQCSFQHIGGTAPRPLDQYAGDMTYFIEYALDSYLIS